MRAGTVNTIAFAFGPQLAVKWQPVSNERRRAIRRMTAPVGTAANLSPGFRVLSGVELLFGAFIVIGHNVFRVVPNEVLILAALGLLSARLRNGGLQALGFKRPESWMRILQIALAAAALRWSRTWSPS
jgi:hypothetical protein